MEDIKRIYKRFELGNMAAVYLIDREKHVELMLYPLDMEDKIQWNKKGQIDSLVQVMFDGDAVSSGFSAGHTFRNSSSTTDFRLVNNYMEESGNHVTITTSLKNQTGQLVSHILTYFYHENGFRIKSIIENEGSESVSVQMLSSFSIGRLTPFEEGEAPGQLKYYRFRSAWSAEGRMESGLIEDLQLEPSWSKHGVSVEKYGQTGSMPVRKFHPFAAIEDTANHVVWAAALACGCSWQMELYRRDENLCISGGLADYDFGHWMKTLDRGTCFESPEAFVTVVHDTFDAACNNLVSMQKEAEIFRESGKKLPVVFNEFCTTWGKPSEQLIGEIVGKLTNRDFDYFVIDAGWYADENDGWENNMGDWNVSSELFPNGMEKAVEIIKSAGLKPGIWFETEVVGKFANALQQEEHLLKKNGKLIRSGDRYFWDMRDPWVHDYLSEKMIHFLSHYGFEYVKIDYNESIGIGCDGASSLGQGLYENTLAVLDFYNEIHRKIPGIVIELCSSGGHRLEPSFLDATDMASFSDAHEQPEIPVIAANLHRIFRPEKSQIWSVIRKEDSLQRICYSITNTFLGVLCISGDVTELSPYQWQLVEKGISFYRKLDRITKNGITYHYGTIQQSYRSLRGWQGIVRENAKTREACIILHGFEENQDIEIPIEHDYKVISIYEAVKHKYCIGEGKIRANLRYAYDAMAILVKW